MNNPPSLRLKEASADKHKLISLLDIPFAFLGFALWRAWVSLSWANPVYPMPVNAFSGQFAYDAVLAFSALVLALFSRKISGLITLRIVRLMIILGLGLTGCCNILGTLHPAWVPALALPTTLLSGIGSALLILVWCEIYSCLALPRVALYYALSFVLGVTLTFILQGFSEPYLKGALVILPALSVLMAYRSFTVHLPTQDQPKPKCRLLIPWKFYLVLALFELASGLCEYHAATTSATLVGPHSTLATLIGGLIIFLWVWYLGDKIPLSALYKTPVILVACGLLLVPLFGFSTGTIGGFCSSMGATIFSALVFLFLCDISKRFGVSALLLFGIEEALLLCRWAGRYSAEHLNQWPLLGEYGATLGALVVVVALITTTTLVLNKKEVADRWGIVFLDPQVEGNTEQVRLSRRCATLAEQYHLTTRETEILELLAQKRSLALIARDLVIAEGTAKAHTRHIYEKLGINTRQELFDLVLVEEDPQ